MNCSKCNKTIQYFPRTDANVMILGSRFDQADLENFANRCPACDQLLCGSCCYPKWEALKQKRGLSGKALVAMLNADPNACFMEIPKCPDCGRGVDPVEAGAKVKNPEKSERTPEPAAGVSEKTASMTIGKRKAAPNEIMTNAIISLLIFAGAYFLFSTEHQAWALVVGLVGAWVFYEGFSERETATCPHCKGQLPAFDSVANSGLLCPSCKKVLAVTPWEIGTGKPGTVRVLADDYVGEDFLFQVKIPDGNYFPMWPSGCCVCGLPATQKGEASHFLNRPNLKKRFTVSDVPYCEKHYAEFTAKKAVGVALFERNSDSKLILNPDKGGFHVLAFRSNKYFQAFKALNKW
jgi:hypothetical protein